MSEPFATIDDIQELWRPLTAAEQTRAEALLPLVSDALRQCAYDVNKDLDEKAEESEVYANVLKSVTVDVTTRYLRQSTEGEAMAQESQGGLGYTWSGTYAVPGGGILNAIMNVDLKRLGLKRQKYGTVQIWSKDVAENESD